MNQAIGYIALVVRDYDEAIAFYTEKLGFIVVEDRPLTTEKRWVLVAPRGQNSPSLLLAPGGDAGTAIPHRQPNRRTCLLVFAYG